MSSRLRPGGIQAACGWDYAEGMRFLRIFWETAMELDFIAADLDGRHRFPLCRPDALVDLLEREGLDLVESRAMEIATPFSSNNSSVGETLEHAEKIIRGKGDGCFWSMVG